MQSRNGPTPISGAISQTRHQASPSARVRPEKSCSSAEGRVTPHPAWSTSHQQEPQPVVIARQEGDAMGRSLLALVLAVLVGGTVGTAAYAGVGGADPLGQVLAT